MRKHHAWTTGNRLGAYIALDFSRWLLPLLLLQKYSNTRNLSLCFTFTRLPLQNTPCDAVDAMVNLLWSAKTEPLQEPLQSYSDNFFSKDFESGDWFTPWKKRKIWDWNISWKTVLFFGICVSLHLMMRQGFAPFHWLATNFVTWGFPLRC